jgi:lipopolysaccharide transport system permease protein
MGSGFGQDVWTENRPSRGWLPNIDARELWLFRETAYHLALRDLKLRYKQTALGVAWVVLQPLVAVFLFTFVFGRLADIPSDGIDYAVFAYSGLVGWLYVSSAVEAAAESLVESRDLVTKSYFPRILAPAAAVLPGLVDLLPSLGILAIFMVAYGVAPDAALLTLPVWILAAMLVALGAGLWLAALNALYRDVRYAVGFGLQVWLFASPVVFPSSLVEGTERALFALNPMVGVIDGLRWALVSGPAPPVEDLVSLASGLAILATGVVYFQRVERRMADRI